MNFFIHIRQHPLIADPLLRWSLGAVVALVAIAFMRLMVALRDAGSFLTIHTNAAGPDFFGTPADALSVPIIGAAVILINLLLTTALARRIPVVARILALGNVWFAVLLFISVGSIISAN